VLGLDGVPELVERWGLTLGEEYPAGACGRVWRATLADGTPVALKVELIQHRESEQEAHALERWDGHGAVRLLAHEGNAMLLERCEPGTYLSEWDGDRLSVLIGLLPRLWVDPSGFNTLAAEVETWTLPPDLHAVARELAATQGERVLVHQDLHGENVLAAEREPWLVIDPKPLAAEREFAVAPIVRSVELGHSRREALGRLDRLCSELGLDRERARLWTIVQTTAWSPDHDVLEWLRT
jgi:streptomycin 6-kinase